MSADREMSEYVRQFIEAKAASAFPAAALWDHRVAADFLRNARARPAPVAPVDDLVDVIEERTDAGLPLRIYRPAGESSPSPLLAFFHGGGWVLGDLDINDGLCRRLALESRCVVVSAQYRLAPEHPYPAALDDAVACYEWVGRCATRFGGDPSRVGVAGSSSGGNLAAALTLRMRDSAAGRLPAIQVLLYPALDAAQRSASHAEYGRGFVLQSDQMSWFWSAYADTADRDDPLLSPSAAPSLSGLPPAVIVTTEFDPLRDEGEDYAERLRAAGVEVVLDRYPGQVHGFLSMVGQWPDADAAMFKVGRDVRTLLDR